MISNVSEGPQWQLIKQSFLRSSASLFHSIVLNSYEVRGFKIAFASLVSLKEFQPHLVHDFLFLFPFPFFHRSFKFTYHS